MTAIVGLIGAKGNVWLGADSALSDDAGGIVVSKDEKVFKLNAGNVGIAYAGSCRVGQLLRYKLDVPEIPDVGIARWMSTEFVDAVKECLREGGFLKVKDGVDTIGEGASAIVGLRSRIFVIYEDFHVFEAKTPFTACGSGMDPALGSLHTSYKQRGKSRDKIVAALKAAEAYNSSVRGPFRIINIPKHK